MLRSLIFMLILLASRSLLAINNSLNSDKLNKQTVEVSYKDILLNDAISRYYLRVCVLRLGLPRYGNQSFEEEMADYPRDAETLLNTIFAKTSEKRSDEAIKVMWIDNVLTIRVDPALKSKHIDYEILLQTALTLIQQANNNKLPVINGRALKAAIEQKEGVPVEILKRKGRTLAEGVVKK
jgi:hypothetical protein